MTPQHRLQHVGIVEVEVGLVGVEAVPVVGVGDRIPGPVRALGIDEDDARAGVFLVGVRPDVEVALGRAGRRLAGALEPGMLVGGMVDDQLGDDADAAPMRLLDEALDVVERAVLGMDAGVLGDVVAVVEPRRGIEGQQPERVDAELGDVVELGDQAGKVADAVVVGIEERLDVQLVDDRVLVPERVLRDGQLQQRPKVRSWPSSQRARCARSRTAARPDRAEGAGSCRATRSAGRASGPRRRRRRHRAAATPTAAPRRKLPARHADRG